MELALEAGAPAIVFREKDLAESQRRDLALAIKQVVDAAGAHLIVASDATLASELDAFAVHLAANDQLPSNIGFGRSCHSIADIEAAHTSGALYAMLSPIYPTLSKPEYGPALGPGELAHNRLPTFALGGICADNAAACISAGAAGVAVMGAVMGAKDPRRSTREILRAIA